MECVRWIPTFAEPDYGPDPLGMRRWEVGEAFIPATQGKMKYRHFIP